MITNCRFFIKSLTLFPFLPFFLSILYHIHTLDVLLHILFHFFSDTRWKKLFNLGCSATYIFLFCLLKWRFLHTINGKYVNIHIHVIHIARFSLSLILSLLYETEQNDSEWKIIRKRGLNARCLNIPYSIPFFSLLLMPFVCNILYVMCIYYAWWWWWEKKLIQLALHVHNFASISNPPSMRFSYVVYCVYIHI